MIDRYEGDLDPRHHRRGSVKEDLRENKKEDDRDSL